MRDFIQRLLKRKREIVVKEIEIDKNVIGGSCPICQKQIYTKTEKSHTLDGWIAISHWCDNKCYRSQYGYDRGTKINTGIIVNVFNKEFDSYDVELHKEKSAKEIDKMKIEIVKEIEYWKENDRYLMAIMTRSD